MHQVFMCDGTVSLSNNLVLTLNYFLEKLWTYHFIFFPLNFLKNAININPVKFTPALGFDWNHIFKRFLNKKFNYILSSVIGFLQISVRFN